MSGGSLKDHLRRRDYDAHDSCSRLKPIMTTLAEATDMCRHLLPESSRKAAGKAGSRGGGLSCSSAWGPKPNWLVVSAWLRPMDICTVEAQRDDLS